MIVVNHTFLVKHLVNSSLRVKWITAQNLAERDGIVGAVLV